MQQLQKAMEIEGWVTPVELSWLRAAALSVPPGGKIFEVGSWKGRSAAALAVGHASLTCVDMFHDSARHITRGLAATEAVYKEFKANMSRLRLRPTVWRMTSLAAASRVKDGTADLVFDDSDHEAKFERHFWAWYAKIKRGGIYCGHDYQPQFPEIKRVLKSSRLEFSVIPGTMIWALIKP